MSSCQWERGGIVVESAFGASGGVTGKAGRIGIKVPVYPFVLSIDFSLIAVFMAGGAGKLLVIAGVGVAIGTKVPGGLVVFSRVDREPGIVIGVLSGFPPRVGGVTGVAGISDANRAVVGVGGGVEVGKVATYALLRESREGSIDVATVAIGERVASGQGEKGVVGIGSAPGKAVWRMAINAVG